MTSGSPSFLFWWWADGLLAFLGVVHWRNGIQKNCPIAWSCQWMMLVAYWTTLTLLPWSGGEGNAQYLVCGYWRPKVVLKVVMWSSGSFRPSNDLSYGRWNFEGIGHSSTLVMKGESVLLTIPSKFRSVFSLITLFSSSISLLISLRRSEFASSGVFGRQWSFLLWLSSLSFQLVPERLSSYWSCNLISWFCLVHFSTLAMSVWIYRASAGLHLDFRV